MFDRQEQTEPTKQNPFINCMYCKIKKRLTVIADVRTKLFAELASHSKNGSKLRFRVIINLCSLFFDNYIIMLF